MRYKLEPSLRDVYVEGAFDRDVLTSAISGCEQADCAIYPIDSVEITLEDLERCGLSNGNRQRVIALASNLSDVSAYANYLCLIDRDLDHWFATEPTIPNLRWTKFCSIESHFITLHAFEEIAVLAGRATVPDIAELFRSTIDALKSLYSLRLADYELNLKMSWVPLKKYLIQGETSVALDYDRYVEAVLNKNKKVPEKNRVLDAAQRWEEQFADEHRLCCRGHDFTELLAWIVSKFNGIKRFGDAEVISRAFVLVARGNEEIAEELEPAG